MELSEATHGRRVTVVDTILNPLGGEGVISGWSEDFDRPPMVVIQMDDGHVVTCYPRKVVEA